jgi:type IV pilus assembly protein PilE
MNMNKSISGGFTLIELMVAVAIIGLLAAIVMPNYMESVRRGHRNDGMDALTAAVFKMEVFRGRTGSYPSNAQLAAANIGTTSAEEFYTNLSVLDPTDDCPLTSCYVLQIDGQNGQEDSTVSAYRISSTGRKERLQGTDWVEGWK